MRTGKESDLHKMLMRKRGSTRDKHKKRLRNTSAKNNIQYHDKLKNDDVKTWLSVKDGNHLRREKKPGNEFKTAWDSCHNVDIKGWGKQLREAGYSQKKISEIVCKSPGHVSQLRRNRLPRLRTHTLAA